MTTSQKAGRRRLAKKPGNDRQQWQARKPGEPGSLGTMASLEAMKQEGKITYEARRCRKPAGDSGPGG